MSTIVWFHSINEYNINEIEKDTQYEKELLDTFPKLLIFTDINNCIDYISNCLSQTIYFILSDFQGIQALSFVYQLEQFIFIYILDEISSIKQLVNNIFIKTSPIICGPSKYLSKLIRHLCYNIKSQESFTTILINPFNLLVKHLHTIDDIDEQQTEHLRFQVILAAFIRSHNTDPSINFIRQIMIDECRAQYIKDTNGLKKIDKFELNENQHSTIHWWSQDSFIYRSINSALHSHHWNSIIKYRYFIVKLHNELKILHQEQYPIVYKDDDKEEEDLHNKFLVYRGQGIFPHDLDLLKNNIGGLVCINSFLSTTSDEELAIAFAQKCEEKATVAVIFQIMLDRRVLSAIFADISTYSNMKNEPEILLSMGCVFRVENVMYDKISDRWSVNIYLTDPNEDSLFSYMLKEFEDKNLGQVLYQMEEYEAARDYCQLMLRYTNDHLIHYSTLGNVLKEMGEYDQALENHYNALKLVKSIYECTEIFYNIGVTYLGKHNSYRALQYYHEASELECVEGETMKLAEIYHDMGLAYINIGALRLGVNYLEKALNIQKNILPSNHYHLGYTYLNLGDYYRNRNEIKQAMEYYQNALEIFRCSRRQDKELVIKTHIRIGQLYINMEQYDMTRKTFEQLAHIYGKTINGLALANIYMYIVVYIFFPKYNFLQCISYIEYVLSIRKQNLPTNHILIGITFYNLGSFQLIFHRQSSSKTDLTILEASRSNLMHAIDILTSHSSYLPKAIENLAHVYYTLKEYDQSIECFKKSINYSSTNDHLLPQRYQNLSCVYEKMCKFKNAIKSLKYALHLYNSSSIGIANTNIIRSHTLLGTYFKFTKNYNAALKHLFIALSLWRMKALPLDTDCVVSAIYYHIADIYYKLNFHRQSFIAQLFHIEYDLRVKQLKSQEETEITSVDPYPGYVNGFVICIGIESE